MDGDLKYYQSKNTTLTSAMCPAPLTGKQKEILLHAYNNGYFDHPRKVNAGELAKKVGMHKTTLDKWF
jgi:predicted DNA binding protein